MFKKRNCKNPYHPRHSRSFILLVYSRFTQAAYSQVSDQLGQRLDAVIEQALVLIDDQDNGLLLPAQELAEDLDGVLGGVFGVGVVWFMVCR